MKKLYVFLLFALAFALPFSVNSQEETLELNLTRDWGYGGFAGEIQGKFSLRASGSDNLIEVRFMIDDAVVATDTEPPFNYQFETGQYLSGSHTLTAVGILSDGSQIMGAEYKRVFLSAEEARKATLELMVPLLAGVGGIIILAMVGSLVMARRNPYQFKHYGMAGGAVCPRCQLPFSRSMLAPNMIIGKLERCPHCGKWSIVRGATPQELEAAEKRYSEGETKVELDSNAQARQLKKSLDDTKYE